MATTQATSLVMLHQTVIVEVYVPEVIQACSFCYFCCCAAFAARFQINQINSIFWHLFWRRFAHLFKYASSGFTLSIEFLAGEVWRHLFGPRFYNITDCDFYHYTLMQPLKNFYTSLSGAPQKCFKSGPALPNVGPGGGRPFCKHKMVEWTSAVPGQLWSHPKSLQGPP